MPKHAARGLEARPDLGVLLPCNVAIHVEGEDVIVSVMEPREMLAILGDDVINELAEDVGARLEELINEIPARTTPKTQESGSKEAWGAGNWPPELQKIIEEFREIDDAMERYEVLYDWQVSARCYHQRNGMKITRCMGVNQKLMLRAQ